MGSIARLTVRARALHRRPVVLLAEPQWRRHHFESVLDATQFEWVEGREEALDRHIDIAIVTDEWFSENAALVSECRRRRIPTLHVIDGVLDWKNTFENPRSLDARAGLPLFQPVLSDKIACLGRAQARILESWGNEGVCEVVGAPRFDRWLGTPARRGQQPGTYRILVTTATTPYFQESHRTAVLQSLRDIDEFFRRTPSLGDTRLEVVWRLPDQVRLESALPGAVADFTGRELAELLRTVDAAIITPSTCVLEAMLADVPVALLDYPNTPHFVPGAWRITAREHLETVIGELAAPAEAKLLFQDSILHDQLECATPAGPRMLSLIQEMVRIGRECRANNRDLVFPDRLLPRAAHDRAQRQRRAVLKTLYPGHRVFRQQRVDRLAAEVGHLRRLLQIHEEDNGYCRQSRTELPQVEHALQLCRASLATTEQRLAEAEQRCEDSERGRVETERRHEEAVRRCAELETTVAQLERVSESHVSRCLSLDRERAILSAALRRRPIVIWGAGEGGCVAKAALERNRVDVSWFVDGDSHKQRQLRSGLPVVAPELLLNADRNGRPFVVIGSQYRGEIAERLRSWGYEPGVDFV
jgi:hypothetical protein